MALFALPLIASGCRGNNPYGSCTTRIPPPGTGTYNIPNGATRSASEPYYQRSDGATSAVAPASSTGGQSTGGQSTGGQWLPATTGSGASLASPNAMTSLASSTAPSPQGVSSGAGMPANSLASTPVANAADLQWRSVAVAGTNSEAVASSTPPASYSQTAEPTQTMIDSAVQPASYRGPEAGTVAGLLPVSTTSLSAADDESRGMQPTVAEPGRLPPTQGMQLPTEAGTIGSGVRGGAGVTGSVSVNASQPSSSGPTSAGRLTVDDLLGPSQASWRPRF